MKKQITAAEWIAEQRAFFSSYKLINEHNYFYPIPLADNSTVIDTQQFLDHSFRIIENNWGNPRIAGPPIRRILSARLHVEQHFVKLHDEEE